MRIVAVADTHTFQADLEILPEGDVFVHAGDLVRDGKIEEFEPVAAWIRRLPFRHKVIIAGNHDGFFESDLKASQELLGDAHYLQDAGIVLDGVHFWGSPWQPAYADWWFNLPRGISLAEKWRLIPTGVDVLITHGPPFGIGDRDEEDGWHHVDRVGCRDLLSRIERVKPRAHLFGHTHVGGGFWQIGDTAYSNVTTWECERAATVIDFDPVTKVVTPVRIPPPRR
jgi:predicted phosphodiesterase